MTLPKELAPGTLRSILKRTGLSVEELLKLLTVLIGVTLRFW
ncbi:MAG: type II toxin-antitoxin system HicA family toxin [Candidatus Omnitrophica bacterium]|nr:type II toxin-antitoxin system HicA family toxin [Candidatus Omnitrophota bacterium]